MLACCYSSAWKPARDPGPCPRPSPRGPCNSSQGWYVMLEDPCPQGRPASSASPQGPGGHGLRVLCVSGAVLADDTVSVPLPQDLSTRPAFPFRSQTADHRL